MNVVKRFLSVFSSKVTVVALGMLITPLVVRLLGSSQYGDYAFLLSVFSITMIFVNAGIFDGLRKFTAEHRPVDHWEEHVFSLYVKLALLVASLASAVFIAVSFSDTVVAHLGEDYDRYFLVIALYVVTRQLFSTTRSSLMGLGKEHISEPLEISRKLIFGVVGLSLAYVGFGIVGLFAGHIVGTILVTAVGLAAIRRRIDLRVVFDRTPPDFPRKELVTFNVMSVLLLFLMASLYHVDVLLLRPLAGSEETGYYRAALVVAEFVWMVPMALQTVLLHSSSEMWTSDGASRITNVASRVTRYNILFTSLLVIGIAVLADSFVPIYFGAGFERAIVPLFLLLPGSFGFAIARPILAIGQGKGDLRALIVATGVAACLNLVLNALLIPYFGMYGAAVATSISYGSMLFLHVWAARSVGFDPGQDLRIPRIATAAVLTVPVLLLASRLISSNVVSLVTVPILGALSYGVFALQTRAVDREEITGVLRAVPLPFEKLAPENRRDAE